MVKISNLVRGASIAACIAAFSAGPAAAATSGDTKPTVRSPCFFITQWRGWRAPSPDVLYLGVNLRDVYKVQLASKTPQLMWPDARLISISRTSSVCDALDLDLKVSGANGFPIGLIATSITKLTPEQVAAIPPKFNPN